MSKLLESTLITGDSYKYGHPFLLRDDIAYQYNYMEARKGDDIIFVGMQYYIKKYLTKVPSKKQIKKVKKMALKHGVYFDEKMWKYINKLGYYPIRINAIQEGTKVPSSVPLATFENTDPECVGLVGFLETLFMKVWMPTSVATQSYEVKQTLLKYGTPDWAEYAYHNFGSRSTTSLEHDMIAGYAHLTQFKGTDSFSSLFFCEKYYNQIKEPAGYSVLATEHSVTAMNGVENEEEFVYNTLLNNPDSPTISFVGDSYDIYKFTDFVTNPNGRIRQLLDKRPDQKLVIRPDSGAPIYVLSKIITIMENNDCFASVINGKLLSTKYGLLWGDGITHSMTERILKHFTEIGYVAENFIFGSGTNLVNSKDRDTQGFAIKCSSVTLKDGTELDVFKNPITAPNKKSKRGRVETAFNTAKKTYRTTKGGYKDLETEALQLVFEDGKLYNETSLENIRSNSLK